ncbi:MAG: radical SAM-associated putative lipoprotein [Tannerella sp.]|jgi:putative lipoprotein (rSAM/lipoprotein system)|nr:radical SAM-associated putative lipoprotein [Tannerella sp.]
MKMLLKQTNWLVAALLTLLGFSGCHKADDETMVEYGVPSARYTVKGKVVGKSTGKPVKGIRVGYISGAVLMYGVPPSEYKPRAVTQTDNRGEFKLTEKTFPSDEAVPVYVEDIDGTENGLYESETLTVSFKNAERTGKPDKWYEGEYTVTVLVELKEASQNE